MSRPRRFLLRMALFLALVMALALVLFRPLERAFLGNPIVNGVILAILLAGIVYIFRQVILLDPEIDWIEGFQRDEANRAARRAAPRLLAPMARMLLARGGSRVSLSPASLQTLLDGIGSRLSETREASRYLIGVLIFLGLLGTFYGLLVTVHSVGGVIGSLSLASKNLNEALAGLKTGLEAPLSGMSTAFSSSLFGLAGSLVLGFLDLQAGQAQNRFYNDLEEWLSSYTRLSSGAFGEGAVPAYVEALLERSAESLESLERLLARSEESRVGVNAALAALTERLGAQGEQMQDGRLLMSRLAENQLELKPALSRLTDAALRSLGEDEAVRGYLRNIESILMRLSEDMARGRNASVEDLRGEIRLLARTLAAFAEESRR
jgi:hypothetical protein